MLNIALFLAAAAAPADTAAPLLATGAAAAQDAPAVTVHRQPALPMVALRLSIVAPDPPGLAGAGHLVQHLHLASLEEQAARVGGRVQAVRGSDAIVYSLVGPASELPYLAGVLRGALRAPTPSSGELLAALSALAEERAAERETAPRYVRAALRARLFPADLPPAGTELAAARLETSPVAEVWGEIYRPERVSLVAVGDVELEAVQRAFRDLPAAPGGGSLGGLFADTVATLEADTPQATRGWIGRAYAAPEASPAALSVATRLLQTGLRRRMTRSQVEVEHWWTHQGQALALVVATADSLLPAAGRTTSTALEWLGQNLSDAGVRDAAAGVRRDMVFFSRTPERMAALIGEFADRSGDPDAAQQFYAALEEVTADDVRAVLAILSAQDPVALTVRAQRIPEAQRR
jgi:predicted Zn-dependent peptidase